ncbi:MAG: hypothetical protein COV35_05895 [Alphaproteobacteria bacterium CG11_big_fil_rev_8_21_14_0_20_39_49]|nr:MAG: hypothetical protein COV35_05895 [Alphaproteobacteria bacterium CG11_big_fil_rev_8_21_14_0_20_39_49]
MYLKIAGFILIIITIVGVSSFYAAPEKGDIALMQLEDKKFSKSIAYYKEQYSLNEDSINVVIPLMRIYDYYGHNQENINIMESFVKRNPDSVEAVKHLASLYKVEKYYEKYCRSLEQLQKIDPSVESLQILVNTYRFLGNVKEEMSALARLLQDDSYDVLEEDYMRLASLYMLDNGNYADASATLLDFYNRKPKDVSINSAYMAVQILGELGETDNAGNVINFFLKTLKKEHRQDSAIVLSAVLHRAGELAFAYEILSPYLDNLDNSPELLRRVVEIKLALKGEREVFTDLAARFEQKKLPSGLHIPLLDLAIQFNDDKLFESLFQESFFQDMDESSLVRYVDKISQIKKPYLASILQKQLGQDYLKSTPLLTALLNVTINTSPNSINELNNLPAKLMASSDNKRILIKFYFRHGKHLRAFSLIETISVSYILDSISPLQFAEIYLSVNKADIGLARINDAIKKESGIADNKKQIMYDTALFLESGAGDEDGVFAWLENHKEAKAGTLSDAAYIASKYKHFSLAVIIFERFYKIDKNPKMLIELSEMMIRDNQYATAAKQLEPLVEDNKAARAAYINCMAAWIRSTGINSRDSEKAQLGVFLTGVMKNRDLSLDEKRNVAYLLLGSGFRRKAEDIFIELASTQPFASNDVSELLGFWGNKFSPKAKIWIERRARRAEGLEKALWLSHINDAVYPEIVISVFDSEGTKQYSLITDEYINSLVLTQNKERLEKLIAGEISIEESTKRLERLATIAYQEDLPEVSVSGWKKLYKIDPQNNEAERALGLAAFNKNRFKEAEYLLKKYLSKNKGDQHVNYAYGEILLRNGKNDKADEYFNLAYKQISEIKNKNIYQMITEASVLYRINRVEDSFDLYDKLLKENPENKSLRVDFAQRLIENKRYTEASLLIMN